MKKISYGVVFLTVMSAWSLSSALYAEESLSDRLAERMDALETANITMSKELAAVKADNKNLREAVTVLKNEVTDKKTSGQINYVAPSDEVYKGKNLVNTAEPSTIKMYGFVKGDLIYNDSQGGELAFNAPREGTAFGEDDEMHLNIRDTRVGLDITGPEFADEGKTKGKIELDFWGSSTGDGDASPNPRIRQAYIDLIYKNWDLRAGQTWDFFSPLNPTSLAFAILWRAGNMGDRHPQLILGRTFDEVLGGKLKTSIGIVEASDLDANNSWPVMGAYASYENDVFERPYYIGAGAIYGEQDLTAAISKDSRIWGYTLAGKLRLTDDLSIKGEGYFGAGLANFRAGSSASVITGVDSGASVRSRGGWLQAIYTPAERWELSAGLGVDDVSTDGTGTTTIWDYNYTHLYGLKYRIAKGLYGGLEYQRFGTKYTQQDGGELSRIMTSIIYKF